MDAILAVPRTRQMYLRRLRSLMDAFHPTGRLQVGGGGAGGGESGWVGEQGAGRGEGEQECEGQDLCTAAAIRPSSQLHTPATARLQPPPPCRRRRRCRRRRASSTPCTGRSGQRPSATPPSGATPVRGGGGGVGWGGEVDGQCMARRCAVRGSACQRACGACAPAAAAAVQATRTAGTSS